MTHANTEGRGQSKNKPLQSLLMKAAVSQMSLSKLKTNQTDLRMVQNKTALRNLRYVLVYITLHMPIDGLLQRGELDEKHQALIGGQLVTKADTTKDLDLMFSKRVKVNFKKGKKETLLNGRWCITCK
jgi:hypothetical protein